MGQKVKNINLLKKQRQHFFSQHVLVDKDMPWLADFKHDFENQLVKIQQKIEYIYQTTRYVPNRKPVEHFEEACLNNSRDVADGLIFIDRIVHQMFCEIACLTVLEGNSEKIQQYQIKNRHVLHKIILRILRIYSEELRRKNIKGFIRQSDIEWDINEDIFSAILLKIIGNCVKFCKPDSNLEIVIENDSIRFIMDSLKIESFEKWRIFNENVSWKNANKLDVPSSWKGLFHAKKLANFHWLELDVDAGRDIIDIDWKPFAHNIFYIKKSI